MILRATSHTRLRAHDHYTSSTLIGGKSGAGPSSLHTISSRDQRSMWIQGGCKVYMDSYMASNGNCFMVTWIDFNNHLLEAGLTQNHWETMALRMLTTVGLFYSIMLEDPHEHKFVEMAFGWGPGHIRLHTTLESPWPHDTSLEVCWDGLWTLSFGLSQFHGHGSFLARVWSGPKTHLIGTRTQQTKAWVYNIVKQSHS